jgi:predicted RNA binding protein YcfA (HicA-like mRNA interferase family)
MTKSEKREQNIRENPNNVRFDDLDLILRDYGFVVRNRGTSHHIYSHILIPNSVNVPFHGSTVKPIYVKQAIAAIDAVIARRAEIEKEQTQ